MTITTTRVSRCGCVWKVTYDENHTITDILFLDIYDKKLVAEDMRLHVWSEYEADPQSLLDDIARREAGLDPN